MDGKVIPLFGHVRVSSATGRASDIKKSSMRTSPRVASLNRLASAIDTPRSPLMIKDKCGSEQPAIEASFAWLMSLLPSIQTANACRFSMEATLLLAKCLCQAILCCGEIDIRGRNDDSLLPANEQKAGDLADPDDDQLFVGQWIRAHNVTPAEVARGAPINEGYLSQIISGKKKNPTRKKLAMIAKFLGIDPSEFYRPPPPARLLDQVADYDPEVIIRLSQKRKSS